MVLGHLMPVVLATAASKHVPTIPQSQQEFPTSHPKTDIGDYLKLEHNVRDPVSTPLSSTITPNTVPFGQMIKAFVLKVKRQLHSGYSVYQNKFVSHCFLNAGVLCPYTCLPLAVSSVDQHVPTDPP